MITWRNGTFSKTNVKLRQKLNIEHAKKMPETSFKHSHEEPVSTFAIIAPTMHVSRFLLAFSSVCILYGNKKNVFVAYCLIGVSHYAVLLIDWVSECNNRIWAHIELCRFRSDVPRFQRLPQRRSFRQSMLQKCCLVTSSVPVWLNAVFYVMTGTVSYMLSDCLFCYHGY